MKVASLLGFVLAAFTLSACDKKDGSSAPGVKLTPKPPLTTETVPAELQKDTLYILHDRHGLEMFRTGEARCNLKRTDGAWEFTFTARGIEPIQRSEELERVIKPEPNFESTAVLPPDNLELKPGRVILQKDYYDHARDQNLTNFYYFDHERIENVRIELLAVTDEWIEAKVTGITGVNSTSSDAKITVITRFKRDPNFGRGIQ